MRPHSRTTRSARCSGALAASIMAAGLASVPASAGGSSTLPGASAVTPKTSNAPVAMVERDQTPAKMWVFFTDKGHADQALETAAVNRLIETYPARAIERRQLRRQLPGLFDARDLPVAERYVEAVRHTGAIIYVRSRWLNAVSVGGTPDQLAAVADLPIVKQMQPVRRWTHDGPLDVRPAPGVDPGSADGRQSPAGGPYGNAEGQLAQINLIALHEAGYFGEGTVIGILDTGFRITHRAFQSEEYPLRIVAKYDFVDDDPNPEPEDGDHPDQHYHGTMILGALASYEPNRIIGAAYGAEYILCKTEDYTGEYQAEEDYYVAGLEFIEYHGGDVATSSLGYIDWYTQDDLDGETAVTTIGVNIATANGLHCCTAAGNEGHDSNPNTSHLIAPADAFQVFTCGAVYSTDEIAGFSSDGPTADGRVKPEVLAQGVDVFTIWPWDDTSYAEASGTSLSTPLIAGAVGSLHSAQPSWTVDYMRSRLTTTADYYLEHGTFDPLYVHGYGIIDAFAALPLFTIDSIVPGDAGVINELHAFGAIPGTRVAFIWGRNEGSTDVPNCPGLTVDISQPRIVGVTSADETGEASISSFVPNGASGLTILFQAVEPDECRVSNVFTHTFP